MKKLYSYCLFFIVFFTFSSFAVEDVSKPIITVKTKTAQMFEVMEILKQNNVKLDETAFFFDFDETLARTTATYKGHDFNFLVCPDRKRTYKPVFLSAFQNSPYSLDYFDMTTIVPEEEIELNYEILDEEAGNLVRELRANACYMGVCSALPKDVNKIDLLRRIWLAESSYIYAPYGKPHAICERIEELNRLNKKISTVVLLDNSGKFAIEPVLEDLPPLMQSLELPDLKIIGIEFTRFTDMVTESAIEEELTLFRTLSDTNLLEGVSSENDNYEGVSAEDDSYERESSEAEGL